MRLEILGAFLEKNAKKMVREDLENKTVITKRHQGFPEIKSHQTHLPSWLVYEWIMDRIARLWTLV